MTCNAFPMRRTSQLAATVSLALSVMIAQPASGQSIILPEGMAITLETRQEISSKSARAGDHVELAVNKPVTIGGITVIPAGTPAAGKVVRVRDNGLLGRSGKLDIQVSSVKAGQLDIPVRGQRNAQGKSGTLGAVGAGIVFLPLAVLVRGKDVKLPAGTAFDVYVEKEITLASQAPATLQDPIAPPQEQATPPIRTVDPNQAIGL